MRDPLHTLQEGEVFVVATLAEGRLVDLEVLSRPPTFHLREDQVALVANVDGGDSAEFLTIGDLLAHCADALGMDTGDEEGPYKPEAMAENIPESIGLDAAAGVDTDSRAEIGDRLATALEADIVADPDQVAGALATALALKQRQGVRLIEALPGRGCGRRPVLRGLRAYRQAAEQGRLPPRLRVERHPARTCGVTGLEQDRDRNLLLGGDSLVSMIAFGSARRQPSSRGRGYHGQ